MYSREAVVDRIAELYAESGLTKAAFAEKIGVTEAAAYHYLKKGKRPTTYVVAQICEAFDVSADWLLFGKN